MHVLIGKRQLVLASLVVILGLAVFVNWYFVNSDTLITPEGTQQQVENENDAPNGAAEFVNAGEADYFAAARLKRSANRDSSLEDLQAVMASAEGDADATLMAAAAIEAIGFTSKRESDIESLVTAATGSDCVAVISQSGVDVIVTAAALTENNVLQITDIISDICPDGYENIKISSAG